MKLSTACSLMTLMLASSAFSAPPKHISADRSASFLIDDATSEQMWKENLT